MSDFESKDDSASQHFNEKINFDPMTFENHVFVATSDLESVNSADFEDEDYHHEFKLEESNLMLNSSLPSCFKMRKLTSQMSLMNLLLSTI